MRLKVILVMLIVFGFTNSVSAVEWNKVNQQNIQSARDYVNRLNADECPMPCFVCSADSSSPIYGTSRTAFRIFIDNKCSVNPTWSGEVYIQYYSDAQPGWYTIYDGFYCSSYRWDLTYQADNALVARNYIQQYKSSFNESLLDNTSSVIDINNVAIPDNEYPSKALLLNVWSCGGIENGYKAVWQDLCSGQVFYTGKGICDDGVYDCVNNVDFTCLTSTPIPSPTPTSMSTPIPTPTFMSTPTPIPTPTSVSSPSPTSSPVSSPVNTPVPPVVPVYTSTVVSTPTDDGTVLGSNIDDIKYDSSVPDEGQDLVKDDTWLDTIFNLFSNHPVIDVIKGSKITTSGELCSLSVNLYGKVIEISFCNLVSYVEIFGYFVTVCASIYAYFIIFKVS